MNEHALTLTEIMKLVEGNFFTPADGVAGKGGDAHGVAGKEGGTDDGAGKEGRPRTESTADEQEPLRVEKAFASDLMSEVLTLLTDNLLLITGLNNIQAVRTAEMADISAVLLVRGKEPTEKMVELASSSGIVLMGTNYSMYRTAGLLYGAGLGYVF